jgi:hypothetical protein
MTFHADTDPGMTGRTGAARISWEHYNPRDLLIRLMRANPDAGEQALAVILRESVLGDESDYLLPILLYFVRNTVSALNRERAAEERKSHQHDEDPDPKIAEAKAKIMARIKAEAEKITLDLVMPNGKPLRDCTGEDCSHLGGWGRRLAVRVGPFKTVGEVLSETDVRDLYTAI